MKTSLLKQLLLSAVALSLSSCATKLTQAQKQKITAIHVPAATTKAGAYLSPNFTSKEDAATGMAMSSAVGFGLVGGLLSEVVVAAERANDVKKNKASTEAIAKHVPQGLDRVLTEQLLVQMKQDGFFGPRLSKQADAPASLRVTIMSYALHSLDDVQFVPVVSAEVVLLIGGQSVRKKVISNPARMNEIEVNVPRAPLTSYAADANLLRTHFETSARQLADRIAADLAKASAP